MNKKASLICLLSVAGLFVGMPHGGLQAGKLEQGVVDSGIAPERSPYKYRLNVNAGYDTRAGTEENGDDAASGFTDVSVGVSRNFGSPRTRVDFDASAGTSYFWDIPDDQSDVNLRLSATVQHQLTRRVDLTFNTIQTYQVEPDFLSGTGQNARAGQYYYTNNALQLGYSWTRKFSTVTSYSFAMTSYQDEPYASQEDRVEHYFAQEFRYLMLPTTSLVAEYRYGIVEYDENPQNSTSHFILGGVDYSANRRLSISLRGGAELREFDGGNSAQSPYGEAILTYAYSEGGSLAWTTRYGFENSEIVGASTNTSLRSGLLLSQKLTAKLSGRLSLYYENTTFDTIDESEPAIDPATGLEVPQTFNPDYSEDVIDAMASLNYALNKYVALSLGYSYTTLASDQPANDYDRHRVMFGVNLSF
jgi:hypothetical protein